MFEDGCICIQSSEIIFKIRKEYQKTLIKTKRNLGISVFFLSLLSFFKERMRLSTRRYIPHVTCDDPSYCCEGVTLEKQANLDITVYRCESEHLQSLRQGDPRSRFFFSHIMITSHFNSQTKKHCQCPLDNPRW